MEPDPSVTSPMSCTRGPSPTPTMCPDIRPRTASTPLNPAEASAPMSTSLVVPLNRYEGVPLATSSTRLPASRPPATDDRRPVSVSVPPAYCIRVWRPSNA